MERSELRLEPETADVYNDSLAEVVVVGNWLEVPGSSVWRLVVRAVIILASYLGE